MEIAYLIVTQNLANTNINKPKKGPGICTCLENVGVMISRSYADPKAFYDIEHTPRYDKDSKYLYSVVASSGLIFMLTLLLLGEFKIILMYEIFDDARLHADTFCLNNLVSLNLPH